MGEVKTRSDLLADDVGWEAVHTREQAASWQRWVLASCLSLNAGALLAVISSASIEDRVKFFSALWLLGGLICSVAYGSFSSIVANKLGWHYRQASSELKGGKEPSFADLPQLRGQHKKVQCLQIPAVGGFVVGVAIVIESFA
jgi:hypothetical protein